MNERIQGEMSALMDDELPASRGEALLGRIARDPALAAYWGRLHLIRDALQGELPRSVDSALSARVRAALAAEPPLLAPHPPPPRWRRPLAALAVAASLAGLAVVGLYQLSATEDGPDRFPALAQAPAKPSPPPAPAGTRWDRPEAAPRLHSYLVNHNEYAAGASMQGMMRYVRIAGYDDEP